MQELQMAMWSLKGGQSLGGGPLCPYLNFQRKIHHRHLHSTRRLFWLTGVCSFPQNFDTKISIYLHVSKSLQIKIYHIYIVRIKALYAFWRNAPQLRRRTLKKKTFFLHLKCGGDEWYDKTDFHLYTAKNTDWISRMLNAKLTMKPFIWNVYCFP